MSKFDELKKAAQDVVAGHVFVDIEAANMKEFELLARPATILELLAIRTQLVEALSKSKRYVSGAYECAFPDEGKNAQVLSDIDAALAAAGSQS